MIDFDVTQWITANFSDKNHPPFNFKVGGTSIAKILPRFTLTQKETKLDDDQNRVEYLYTDSTTGLAIKLVIKAYPKYNAVDMVLNLTNRQSINSPIIENLQVFDSSLYPFLPTGSDQVIHHSRGSYASKDDFEPFIDALRPKKKINFHPVNGRSSNKRIFPFFQLETKGTGGVFIAVGWSGQWASSILKNKTGEVQFTLGMEHTRLYLKGGETIRTPRILLFPWRGTRYIDGNNAFRRFITQFYVPHQSQNQKLPVRLPLAFYGCRGFKHSNEANLFTEADQIEYSNAIAQFNPEIHWIDAGWFEGRWPNGVGSWIIRKDGFPNGFRPVSENDKRHGIKLLVWFEIERVHIGSWLALNHPEWCLTTPKNKNMLFDLGNPDAKCWMINHITTMIREQGIGLFRLDFNHDPLPFWKRADEKDRQGMHEIRHIEGLYELWDELHRQFPGMITDNCASGGRRIDLESVSRNVSLTRSDYGYYEPNGQQSQTCGVHLYIPIASTFTNEFVAYKFRSAMGNGIMLAMDPFKEGLNVEFGTRLIAEFQQVRDLFYQDFYPLTPYSVKDYDWCVFQFHDPAQNRGMVLAFRRHQAPLSKIRVNLDGLDKDQIYQCSISDENLALTDLGKLQGNQLRSGFDFEISKTPGSILFQYHL